MIGRLRQLLQPRLIQQAGIEKSQTPVERDILIQWVRITQSQLVTLLSSLIARHFVLQFRLSDESDIQLFILVG